MQISIHDSHGFQILGYDIAFEGICPSCQKPIAKFAELLGEALEGMLKRYFG